MKLSTFQIVLLAVFGSLGVAGIMIFALIQANVGTSSIGAVVIWGTLDEGVFRTMLRESTDNDNRYSEVTYVKKDAALYDSELKDALASGKGPDLFIMRQDRAIRDGSYAVQVPYDQFSEAQFRGTFLNAAEPFLGKEGVIAVPILVDPLVLFWNKDALASANIPAPPQYWDQLPAMVAELVKKNESGIVEKGGIALGNFDNIPAAKDIITTLIMQTDAQIMGYDSAGVLRPMMSTQGGTSKAVTALNFYTEFANPAQPDYTWSRAFRDARAAFAAADVAMYIGHASDYKIISEINPNLHFEMAMLPQIRSATYALDTAHVYGIALSRNSQNKRGAITMAFLLADESKMAPIAKEVGMASALKRVLEAQKTQVSSDPTIAQQQNALTQLVGSGPRTTEDLLNYEANISRSWPDPDPDKTNDIFRDMIESTVSGAQKATEAVQRADKQLGEILNL